MTDFTHFFEKLEEEGSLVKDIASLGWAFWPNEQTAKGGYFDEIALRALADEIERRNKPFWDEYEEYCKSLDAREPSVNEDTFSEFDAR